MQNSCPVCSRPIEPLRTGRPRRFCSDGCRRLAQSEQRGLEQRIESLTWQLQYLDPDALLRLAGTSQQRERARLSGLLHEARTRLRALIDAPAEQL